MTRLLWVRLHRWLGLAMAGFLALSGLTGSLIAFNPELDAWLNPGLFHVAPDRPALPLDRLVQSVEAADPQVFVAMVTPGNAANRSTLVTVEPRQDPATGERFAAGYNQVFVDPGSGAILGRRLYGAWPTDTAHVMPFIVLLHYSLHMPNRWGDLLLGIVAIAWLADSFIGVYLTLPARASIRRDLAHWWGRWRPSWQIKRGANTWRLNFDLHRASGLWLWPLLIVLALTSVAMNLNREIFTPIVGLFGTVTPSPFDWLPTHHAAPPQPKPSWDQAVEAARRHATPAHRDMPLRSIYFAEDLQAFEVILMEPGDHNTALRLNRETVFVHAATGQRLAATSYDQSTRADKFLAWQYPLHSGQIGGLAGRIVVCILGLAVCALSITGVLIWLLKRRARLGAEARRAGSAGTAAELA